MKLVGAVILFASMAWAVSWVVLALLRRGIQITYIVPMMPKQEQRMNETIQLVSPVLVLGAGLYLAASTRVLVGLLATALGVAMLAVTVRHRAKRPIEREIPRHRQRPGD